MKYFERFLALKNITKEKNDLSGLFLLLGFLALVGMLIIAVQLLMNPAEAQTLEWAKVEQNTDGTPANVTGYRIYFSHITDEPDSCDDESCSAICPAKNEMIHAIDVTPDNLKYDMKKDPVFKPGSLYEVQIAAVTMDAENKKFVESQKSDATVCVKIKESIPESPEEVDDEEGSEVEHQAVANSSNQTKETYRHERENEDEEDDKVIFSGGFIAGSVGRASIVGDSSMGQRRQSDGRQYDSSKQVSPVLGSKPGDSNYARYKSDRVGTAAANAYFYNRRHEDVPPNPVKPDLGQRAKRVFRDDNSHVGRYIAPGISTLEPRLQSNDSVSTNGTNEHNNRIKPFRIFELLLGLMAITLGVLGLYKTIKGKRHVKLNKNNDHHLDSLRYINDFRRNR